MRKKDLIILIVPFIIIAIIYPFLPAKIPRQFHSDGTITYMTKEFIFLFGFLPFVVYRAYKKRRK